VLTVVGRRLGIALARRQCLYGAAERRPRLVERDVGAPVDEVECRGQTGQPSSHDRNPHRTSPLATTASFAGVDSRHDRPKTS
jgi:hypothetical protein